MKIKIILFRFSLIIACLVLLSTSCEKDKSDNQETICGTKDPLQELDWLKNLINVLENAPKAEVYLYTYKGEKVFSVAHCAGCPDGITEVIDCDSNVICVFGGIAGFNTCPDFYSTAVEDSLLWKNY